MSASYQTIHNSDTDYSYIFSDDDYEFTEVAGNGYAVSFHADGGIEVLTIKECAIDEIRHQPYF